MSIHGCQQKDPPLVTGARGDEATDSPALSIASAYSKKGTLSSLEDEPSLDETPLGEGIGKIPNNEILISKNFPGTMKHGTKRHQCMHCLTGRVSEMVLMLTTPRRLRKDWWKHLA